MALPQVQRDSTLRRRGQADVVSYNDLGIGNIIFIDGDFMHATDKDTLTITISYDDLRVITGAVGATPPYVGKTLYDKLLVVKTDYENRVTKLLHDEIRDLENKAQVARDKLRKVAG